MYEAFYGFREKPFSMTPDAGLLYASAGHDTALTMLRYGLMNEAGITVLTGGIGTGKTTLLRKLLSELDEHYVIGLISNTHQSFGSLMDWVAVAFGLAHAGEPKAVIHDRFLDLLITRYGQGQRGVLIVDEAQNLALQELEELRLLTNINADKHQLLQLVLVGQPELREKLRSQSLLQFAQRVGVDYHLKEFEPEETMAYVAHRVERCGGPPDLFESAACRFVHYQCSGVPRLINSLCDTALVYGYASQASRIGAQLVYDMVIERIRAGLMGAGDLRFTVREGETQEAAYRRSVRRARRRAAHFLTKALEEAGS